jgi:AraC-like DNA-binding protein
VPEEITVKAGQAFLLFPGEWHRYRPDPAVGWTEVWMGFKGQEADRIVETFFDRTSPVRTVFHPEALDDHLDRLLAWIHASEPAGDQVLASFIPLALALVGFPRPGGDPDLVAKAKSRLMLQPDTKTDLPNLARDLGVSYSKLRFAFKEQTGFSLRAFENRMKLNQSKDLLRYGKLSVSETAHRLGYANVHYFSTAFKKQFGLSPTAWKREGGE